MKTKTYKKAVLELEDNGEITLNETLLLLGHLSKWNLENEPFNKLKFEKIRKNLNDFTTYK